MTITTTRPPIHEIIVVILAGIIMAASIGTLLYLIFVEGTNGSTLNDCDKMNVGDGKTWNKGLVFDLQEECFNLDNIDCSNVAYSSNVSRTLMIMKFCTDAEKELD